jgi:uncharacterized phage protein gp47/JayE
MALHLYQQHYYKGGDKMYFTPYVDSAGMHVPSYSDIRDDLIAQAKLIFGNDIYLDSDSQDYQFISIFAAKCYDAMQTALLSYNNRSPSNAIGTGLDSLVKLNGITRLGAVYSTAAVTITGAIGTLINNGVIADISGNKWNLPSTVTIPSGGTISVTATCQIAGAIVANIGDLSNIVTPTYGWTSVTNTAVATIGTSIESDSTLRIRQGISTALPSQTRLEGTKSAILGVSGVTRYSLDENSTGTTNTNGTPAHSIWAVVEGGVDADVANAIYQNKSIGCGTYGTTTVSITDTYGGTNSISFSRPTYKDIDVAVNITGFSGYTTDVTTLVKSNLVNYLNSLKIGEDLTISSLWGVVLLSMPDLKSPLFSVTSLTACLHSGTPATTDISIAFNEVTRGNLAYITVNVS